jgi:apolipoprotein N-acyltransferase
VSEKEAPETLVAWKPALGLAVLSGFLYFLAFPGVDWWPLGFVTWVPLLIAMRGRSPRRAALLGWLAGFTMTMTGFYWLMEMLKTFSGFGTALCLLFMSILCAYQGGRIALHGWLYARIAQRGWAVGLAFSLAFVASELIFPLLFPWAFGAVVHQLPVLTQVAELGGPIAIGLVVVAANLAIAEAVIARLERRKPRLRTIAALSAVPLIAAVYGVVRIAQVDAMVAAAPKARVGLVQANMSLFGKRKDKQQGLIRHLRLTNQLKQGGPLDLVVWSETSVVAPLAEELAPTAYSVQFASGLGVPALFGGVLIRRVPDAREYVLFNSALLSDASGTVVGRYDKQYLLAFGEYLPFGDTFPVLYELSPHSGKFTPGKTLKPLPLGEHEIATFICYEDILPSFVNSIVRSGKPDLLVNITNDAWFGDSTEPWIHLALAKFRAIEHRRFFVRSTNSGVSAFVDPAGRVVSHTGTFREEALAAEIAWLRPFTPFQLWSDVPWWLVSGAAVTAAFVRRPPRKRPVRESEGTPARPS